MLGLRPAGDARRLKRSGATREGPFSGATSGDPMTHVLRGLVCEPQRKGRSISLVVGVLVVGVTQIHEGDVEFR